MHHLRVLNLGLIGSTNRTIRQEMKILSIHKNFGVLYPLQTLTKDKLFDFKKIPGAYCFSMSSNYNSRYKPKEVFWIGGEGHLIRREEKFDDLIRNQVNLSNEVLAS